MTSQNCLAVSPNRLLQQCRKLCLAQLNSMGGLSKLPSGSSSQTFKKHCMQQREIYIVNYMVLISETLVQRAGKARVIMMTSSYYTLQLQMAYYLACGYN